jgi:hypothetical protein
VSAALIDVLDRTAELVRAVDVRDEDREAVLVAVNRLSIDLAAFAHRLAPRAGKNGTPVPLPPTRPAPPPKPPADPKGK